MLTLPADAQAAQAGRRRLLQGPQRPSTAVDISIGVSGQQQYAVVMADLTAMTRPGAGLLAQLQASGKFQGLQSVQLASAVIILPPRGPGGGPGARGGEPWGCQSHLQSITLAQPTAGCVQGALGSCLSRNPYLGPY